MKATFVELPPFERLRAEYLDDEAHRELQLALMANPEAGDVIERDQADDLSSQQRKTLKELLKQETELRQKPKGTTT